MKEGRKEKRGGGWGVTGRLDNLHSGLDNSLCIFLIWGGNNSGQNCEIHAKGFVRESADPGNVFFHLLRGTAGEGSQQATATGVGHSSAKLDSSNTSHATADDGMLDAQHFSHTRLEGHFLRESGKRCCCCEEGRMR